MRGSFLRHIAPKSNTLGEMWQRWQAVGTTTSDLIDPKFQLQTSRFKSSNYKFTSSVPSILVVCVAGNVVSILVIGRVALSREAVGVVDVAVESKM